MSDIINETRTVNLEQATQLIVANPDVRYMLRGEPGIGKSSLALAIKNTTGYPLSMVDVPNLDLGDVAMPVIDHENKATRYYPNARFGLTDNRPVVIMLDEFTKGAEPVKNMLHPMLEVFQPRLGDLAIPEGTIVILTGNLDTDGVGDGLAQHTRQRIVELIVRKPNADEWLRWAVNNGVSTIVMAWVDRYRYALGSYLDGEVNEFNFNPAEPQKNVVSPRTLEIASRIVMQREHFDDDALASALTGTAGAPFSESLVSFIRFQEQLPPLKSIVNTPDKAEIPEDSGARAVLTFGLLEYADKDNLSGIMKYLRRMEEEWQVIFGVSLAKHKAKQSFIFNNPDFKQWCIDNEDLL